MKVRALRATILSISLLSGCSEPTIDASSDEAMESSSVKVRESLPVEDRAAFDAALVTLAFSQIDVDQLFSGTAIDDLAIDGKVRNAVDGKTAAQVIAEAARVTAEIEARERAQALEEIKELKEKQIAAETARNELRKFEVLRSRFYIREEEYVGKTPIIELTVKNGTSSPISRAYFKARLASPNRSVAWHEDTFNYSISGGLEPGEEASWRLSPGMYSDWGEIKAPVDAIFTVETEQLDGADGKTLYSIDVFGEREAARLAELKKQYSVE